jgi:hypothetical protein
LVNVEKHTLQQDLLQKIQTIGLRFLALKVESQIEQLSDIMLKSGLMIFYHASKIKIQFFCDLIFSEKI